MGLGPVRPILFLATTLAALGAATALVRAEDPPAAVPPVEEPAAEAPAAATDLKPSDPSKPAVPAAGGSAATADLPEEPPESLISDESERTAQREPMVLTIGEDRLVDIKFEANDVQGKGIIEGNPQTVKAQLIRVAGKPKQLLFKPLKEGTTTVTVRDEEANVKLIFDVTVTSRNLAQMMSELQELLQDIEGITLKIVGKNIIVDGEVLVPSDYGRLLGVIEEPNSPYKDVVMNLTSFSTLALQALARRIENDVKTFAPSVKTRVVNGRIWLEGTVDNKAQSQRAVAVAELYVPQLTPPEALEKFDPNVRKLSGPQISKLIQNFILINAPAEKKQDKLIRMTVHFVELNKDYARVFGFKWQPGFTQDENITIGGAEDGSAGAATGSFAATISNLFPRLQSAMEAGFARILKTGTVIVRNAQNAQITDQSEFAFSLPNAGGQSSNEKAVTGISVAVTPKIVGKTEDIEMDLDMNQVNVIGATSQGAPITSKHSVKTKIFVRSKESAAVAALNSSEINTDFNKDDPAPGSFRGQTGPLFSLLRSKGYKKKKTQIVIFVTPLIVENASDGTSDLKKNFRVKVE